MPNIVLFVIYFTLLLLIINYIVKKKVSDLSFWQIGAIFSFKVLLGCLYGYIFLKYYGGDDTWNFFNDSLGEYQKLIQHPGIFFNELLPGQGVMQAGSFVQGLNIYLPAIEYRLTIKMLAVFNIFSRGNYYIDVLFFESVVCWGPFLLFKLLSSHFPNKKNALSIAVFFIPSITFWISGIRAEGLLLLFMSLVLFYSNKQMDRKKFMNVLYIISGFVGIFIFRLEFLLVFLIAFFCWLVARKKTHYAIYIFLLVYIGCLCIFFLSLFASPQKNPANLIIKRQYEFFALHGKTRFKLDSLQPTAGSFIKIFPQALTNTFARPFIWEAKGSLQWVNALGILGDFALLLLVFVRPEKNIRTLLTQPLLLLFIFYGVSEIILIGYISPFPGAIVRYKSIPLLFLIIVAVILIDWKKPLINYNKK